MIVPFAAPPVLVSDYLADGCSTAPVRGLSMQIAEEVACMDAGALTAFEATPEITFSGPQVLPFLAPTARDALLAAVAAEGRGITINSAYRTIANQYLLYHWWQTGRCGITAAAEVGRSNHESGRAVDVDNYSSWITALGRKGWSHDVPGDPVHFDHLASPDGRGADVLAFQRLWNRNHPEDLIDEDGDYGPMTDARLGAAPAEGFGVGSACGASGYGAMPFQVAAVEVEEGDTVEVVVEMMNSGAATWTPGRTFLGTTSPQDRTSELADATWVGPTRAATVEADTPPGATGRFRFLVRGPAVDAATGYTETFGLVEEGVTWFGPEVSLDVLVVPEGEGGQVDWHGHGHGQVGLDGSASGGCGAAPGHTRAGLGTLALCALAILLTRRPRQGT